MEVQSRRFKLVQNHDQENLPAAKGKANLVMPIKRQGLTTRGALGEINSNVQLQRDVAVGKVAVAAAEFEKKATLNRGSTKTAYSYVQSKIDTGLNGKAAQVVRPPLRREESTAGHAAKAAAKIKLTTLKKNGHVLESNDKKTEFKKPLKPVGAKLTNEDDKKVKSTKQVNKEEPVSLEKLKLENELSDDDSPALPDDIEDIDAMDKDTHLLMSIYIKDIYSYLTDLEIKYPIHENFLKNQEVITGKMRATLLGWLVEVQQQFELVLETFHMTVGIIDRYLQIVNNVQRNRLQLIGITALFIASKYEEIYPPVVDDFVFVTDNAYTKADIFKCEREIMTKLGFCLARPIPLSFLRRFIKAAHGSSKNHHLAKYFVDLSLMEYTMAHYRPSELAAAAICLSLSVLSDRSPDRTWTPTLVYYSRYRVSHIKPIIRQIAQIVRSVESSKFETVYKRYKNQCCAKVSTLPQLKGDLIAELAGVAVP